MAKSITPFSFESHQVRVLTDDHGEPLFVAKDVAEALGYKDPTTAIKSHCRGVQELHPIQDALGRPQDVRVIREPDLYRLIFGSTLPSAQDFERLVVEDILPSIRKTGAYRVGQPVADLYGRAGTDISAHRVRCYFALKNSGQWMTNQELAKSAKVSARTARAYTKLFCDERIVDRLRLSPGHQFRIAGGYGKLKGLFVRELELAAEVLGIRDQPMRLALVQG
ncbi:BRO family protein [uncultured Thiodictyon sp.]|uniref:BRO-N domain-containing protein n=1 Tax=uncultured Thiodictyon sp. TaxID=1846217 RepID=UPI0025FB34C5|nr:BRO family protein [uncultured Thiodictyon sp.]